MENEFKQEMGNNEEIMALSQMVSMECSFETNKVAKEWPRPSGECPDDFAPPPDLWTRYIQSRLKQFGSR